MLPAVLSVIWPLAIAVFGAAAQTIPPLVDDVYTYGTQPYKAVPVGGTRGPQTGYNICNSTTQNQDSQCQTMMVNSIADFCLWAPPTPNSTIADTEAIEVAYCTKNTWGTRVMLEGSVYGVTVYNAPSYTMIVGFINQSAFDMNAEDYGGELDSRGQDGQGNPIGGLTYSNAFPRGNTNETDFAQIIGWNVFIGGNEFCVKICSPTDATATDVGHCNNVYDEIGISYNCPNSAQNGTYAVCDSDDMTPVGIYVVDGVTSTYSQPFTPISTVPYTPVIPSSSNCVTYQSSALYTDFIQTSTPTVTPSPSNTGSSTGSSPMSGSGSSGGTKSGSPASMQIPLILSIAGIAWAVFLLS